MKRYLVNIILVALLLITLTCIPNQVNAAENINTGSYKPTITNNSRANAMISKIFGALQVVGGIAIVISIAMIGFNSILGSADEKAQGKGKAVGILFGAIMIIGVSTIAKLILSVVE